MACQRCGAKTDPMDANCPKCGAPQRVTDPRFCPWCGMLKNQLYDICPDCANAYEAPGPSQPLQPTRTTRDGDAICPACGKPRHHNDAECPWCDSPLPPLLLDE